MSDRWSTKSVALHWVSTAVIMAMGAGGFVMSDLAPDSSLRLLLSRSHTLFGFTLMALTVLRLVTRWRGPSPDPLPLPPLHRRGVGPRRVAGHVGLVGYDAGLRPQPEVPHAGLPQRGALSDDILLIPGHRGALHRLDDHAALALK